MAARVRHRLVILDPRREAVLLVGGDRPALPEIVLEERHTAEVEHLNAAVRERFGLRTTVLLALAHDDTPEGARRTQVLECHDAGALLTSGREPRAWVEAGQIEAARLDGESAHLLRRARASMGAAEAGTWARTGWWPAVRDWIELQVGPCEIVQTRAWESSCVARVRALGAARKSSRRDFFFKALPEGGAREAAVCAYLSRLEAPGAPDVAAADLARRWLLMRAFDGRSLDDVRDPESWERAAATYGRLQAATLGCASDLRALGCRERRLEDLAAAIEPLLADTAALMPGHPEGLTPQQIERARARAADLHRCCDRLAAARLPAGLDHGDLWPSNILANERACVVIDWEDACLQQPFLSLGPLLAMRREWGIDLDMTRLAHAYLAPFAAVLDGADLEPAFEAALPLALFDMAVRYWHMPAAVCDLHPWMREMVPFFLRHLLAA